MYRMLRFLEILIAIREEMAREADFDVDLFVENVRTGRRPLRTRTHSMSKDERPDAGQQTIKSRKAGK